LTNAQPYLIETALGPLGIAHNGNLTNTPALRRDLLQYGVGLISSSDSEVITQMLAGATGETWDVRIQDFMSRAKGAYSLTILTQDAVYAARDPWGFRPLCLGRLNGNGWVVASESCALGTIDAHFEREVRPGEIVRLDSNGLTSWQTPPAETSALCIFEYVYFARPDSIIEGRSVHGVRRKMGAELAREHPVDADMVIGVPDSATAHAIGYASESGIPYGEGLIKNRYIGRTFIQPDERLRRRKVALKYNPLPDLSGKRIVLVDDSIVRGTTSGPIVALLRQAGAREIHMRVASPPIRYPCFMGVDMATQDELIAARKSVAEIAAHIDVDTLGYLSLDGLRRVVPYEGRSHCQACFNGDYPVPVESPLTKEAFER
jgi:amidophosphoribosyltransferase